MVLSLFPRTLLNWARDCVAAIERALLQVRLFIGGALLFLPGKRLEEKLMSTHETELDVLDGCKITSLDDSIDITNSPRFAKLDLTQGQKMQISALVNQLPAMVGTSMLSNTLTITFPEGVQGVLMKLKAGGYSTTLKNPDTGKIVGTASLDFSTSQAVCLGAFTAMSVISGQYFLSQINNSLKQISSGLDKILEFLYGDKRAELLSEVSFIQFAYKNYQSVMEHSDQKIATLISLQNAKKVAMKDIEFYLSDLSSTMSDKKSNDISTTVPKVIRTKECLDLSLQLYTMSNLLEVYYAENFDPNYISFVQDETTVYIGKCEKRLLNCFGQLKQLLAATKENPFVKVNKAEYMQQIDDILAELESSGASPLQTTLQSALTETRKEKQYCLNRDGEVYLKVS